MAGAAAHEAVVIGASAGGLPVIKQLIQALPANVPPVIIVQHMAELHEETFIAHLSGLGGAMVKEVDEKEKILKGTVYLAPGNYHLLVEPDKTFSLSIDQRVNFARPSINILFETAAQAYGPALLGVILSGGNDDGARGALRIRERGGTLIVQDPRTAMVPSMPQAALAMAGADLILDPEGIVRYLFEMGNNHKEARL